MSSCTIRVFFLNGPRGLGPTFLRAELSSIWPNCVWYSHLHKLQTITRVIDKWWMYFSIGNVIIGRTYKRTYFLVDVYQKDPRESTLCYNKHITIGYKPWLTCLETFIASVLMMARSFNSIKRMFLTTSVCFNVSDDRLMGFSE